MKVGLPGRVPAVLVAVSLGLMLAAWVPSTLPFGSPDEASHYLRALSIAHGVLLGPKVPYPFVTPASQAFVDRDTRGVMVSALMSPQITPCENRLPNTGPHGCLEPTEVGNYLPLPYLLPAVALNVSHDATTGLWLSRVAAALPCLAFIMLAVALLWSGTASSLLGLLAAATPMSLFVSSVLNPNGLEVAAGLACAAAVLRISRDPGAVAGWTWAALAAAGTVTILAWQLGPVFVALDLGLLAVLLGRRGLSVVFFSRSRASWGPWLAILALVIATVLYVVYARIAGLSHADFGVSPIVANLHAGVTQLEAALRDSVGNFGALTVPLPTWVRRIWWLLVVILVIAAAWVSGWRDRAVLATTVLGALAFPVVFYAWVYRFSGFGLQGRYTLPVVMLIPLLAGELVHRRVGRFAGSRAAPIALGAAFALIAGLQAYAWSYNAQRTADDVPTGWSPPLGWAPWITLAALGTVALITVATATTVTARGEHVRRA